MENHTVTLASGHQMPLVGLGLWKVPVKDAADTVYNVRESSRDASVCNLTSIDRLSKWDIDCLTVLMTIRMKERLARVSGALSTKALLNARTSL